MQVVDGVQRLTTIFNFVRGENFALGAVDYLNDLRNATFNQLGAPFKRRMNKPFRTEGAAFFRFPFQRLPEHRYGRARP